MYIDIEKVLKLAETALSDKKEAINKIKKNEYFPFVYREYLFKYEFGVCQWEATKEAFTQPTDIMNESILAAEVKNIIEAFFNHLLPADY